MFDTIRMKVSHINISPVNLNQPNIKAVHKINKDTGEISTNYEIKDDIIPYIVYYETSKTLLIQVSIPKFLYGENVTLINESDIQMFFIKLNERFIKLIEVDIDHDDWRITSQIDVCWNFKVGRKVSEYIMQISKLKIPYKNSVLYNQCETINFQNGSSLIKLYDKQKESIDNKASREVIDAAKGIIRLEVCPSVHEIKKQSKIKQATKLLSKEFFEIIINPVLLQFETHDTVEGLEYDWLKSQKIKQIEMCLAFMKFIELFNEPMVEELYGSQTFNNRLNLIKQIQFPNVKRLPKLYINYDDLA